MENWRYFHGENSITFFLFGLLGKKQLSRLLANAKWNTPGEVNPKTIEPEQIEYVHLFPNFGKRYGYGEPDAIIITDRLIVYVEVELIDLSKRKLPDCFTKQMGKFMKLATDLKKAKVKKLLRTFEGESGYSFYGRQSLRRVFNQITSKKHAPCFLIISSGNNLDLDKICKKMRIPDGTHVGWISFNKIKRMKGIREIKIARVINHILNK